MRRQSKESNAEWTWRHTTDQSVPFEQWQAEREAAARRLADEAEQRRAAEKTAKEQALQAMLAEKLAAAAAKFGTAAAL